LAKKKTHEEEIRRGLEELGRSGVALAEAEPSLVPRLQEWGGGARPAALAAVFLLGKIADPSAVEALTAIDRQVTDKEVKREIKRALFKLSQRGLVTAPDRAEPSPGASLFSGTPDIEAYMSPVDGSGGRLVWIVKPQPNRGLQALQAMVNDREGLERVGGGQMPRKQLRKMAEEIKDQHGVTMIAVPWQYADAVVYESFENAKSRGRTGFGNFHELRALITTRKPEDVDHPVYKRLQSRDPREGAWRERSRLLLEEPELRFWILDPDWMQPFIPEIQEAQTSRLVLNPAQKEERLAGIVRNAVKELCSEDKGKIFRRRMEDMALYFVETGRPEQANLACAVALQIAEGDPGPLDVSFLTGLVQKTFAFYLSQEKAKAEEEPSLIVKP
jgi:hypothetical protein